MVKNLNRRLGKIEIPSKLIDEYIEELADVLKLLGIVPVRVEHVFYKSTFEIIGFSHKFREVERGGLFPEYSLEITYDDLGDVESVSVKEEF